MKHLHFDVKLNGFYGAYWACAGGSDCAVIFLNKLFIESSRLGETARRNSFFEYSCLRIPSRVMKPSIGRVNCKTIKAMDTVLNLLYIGA